MPTMTEQANRDVLDANPGERIILTDDAREIVLGEGILISVNRDKGRCEIAFILPDAAQYGATEETEKLFFLGDKLHCQIGLRGWNDARRFHGLEPLSPEQKNGLPAVRR